MIEKKCIINGCDKSGRCIGKLGHIDLIYCHKHEDFGIRALNFLINSKFRYKLTKFLDDKRQDLLQKGLPTLCEECNKKFVEYTNLKVKEIEELEK